MKLRIVSLLCALVLSASLLAGCGSTQSSDPADESQSASTAQADPDSASEPASDPASEPAVEEEEQEEEQPEIQLGSWDGQTYTNSWTGITFTLPDGWTQLTSEQILQVVGAGNDVVEEGLDLDSGSLSADTGGVDTYDFYAMRADGTAGFFCDVVNPAAAGTPSMTPEEYLQQVSSVLQVMDGLTVEAEEPEETTFGPLTGVQLNMTTTADSTGMTTAMSYFASAKDGYLVVYFLSASSQEGLTEVIDLIEQIDGTQS